MSTECRAQNPLTCRVHGAAIAGAYLLPGKVVRSTGLAPADLAKYVKETVTLEKRLKPAEQDALRYYTSIGYSYINGWLRNGLEGLVDAEIHDNYRHVNTVENRNRARNRVRDLIPRMQAETKNLDGAFKKAAAYDAPHVLYKAFRVRNPDGLDVTTPAQIKAFVAENYPVGKIIQNKAYTSTSIDPDYMLVHARRRPSQVLVHEIVTDKGLPLHVDMPGSIQSSEREMLLPRDIKLEVVNITHATFEHSGLGPDMGHWGLPVPQRKRFTVVQFREVD